MQDLRILAANNAHARTLLWADLLLLVWHQVASYLPL